MGTLVLDDLVDDPRVVGPRTEPPGDSGRTREDAGQPRPVADPRDQQQHADREQRRRRLREAR